MARRTPFVASDWLLHGSPIIDVPQKFLGAFARSADEVSGAKRTSGNPVLRRSSQTAAMYQTKTQSPESEQASCKTLATALYYTFEQTTNLQRSQPDKRKSGAGTTWVSPGTSEEDTWTGSRSGARVTGLSLLQDLALLS